MVERSLVSIIQAIEPIHHKIAELTVPEKMHKRAELTSAAFGLYNYMQGAKDTFDVAVNALSDGIVQLISRQSQDAPEMQLGNLSYSVEQAILADIARHAAEKVSQIKVVAEELHLPQLDITLTESLRQLSEIAHPGKGNRFRS